LINDLYDLGYLLKVSVIMTEHIPYFMVSGKRDQSLSIADNTNTRKAPIFRDQFEGS
jgi:hypothetical protein